ncbi:MAG: ABC transporter permease [Bacillota bacterium]|uniref:Ribose ABC transporter permease n=1 Tax=Thermanaerosceptrum fracticalcis TaxID=1712410 RepID=A0A7G6E5F1_THEFR|nr:ribose ABC transporter permease [Thermanaerosceptrum fracticalcis]QNB47305.1 ribose ABC transporter permease [Thermanaerosceptrum fracticalcis]
MKNWLNKQNFYKLRSLLGLILLAIILTLLTDRFLTLANLTNVLRQTSINAIIAVGMTVVAITGGIDLSVGSILAFAGAFTAGLLTKGMPVGLAVMAGLLTGVAAGLVNGLLITRGKIAPFIATLAMMTMLRGATYIYTDSRPITGLGDGFRWLGWGTIGPLPVPVLLTVLTFLAGYYLLKHNKLGRYLYAVGSNEEAARLSGIDVGKTKVFAYMLCGFLAALSAIISTSRLDSAPPNAGMQAEMDAIAAAVLGGTSLSGGVGGVTGTFVGALIIGVLNNGLNLLNVSSNYQLVAKGLVILLAVLLDRKSKTA